MPIRTERSAVSIVAMLGVSSEAVKVQKTAHAAWARLRLDIDHTIYDPSEFGGSKGQLCLSGSLVCDSCVSP